MARPSDEELPVARSQPRSRTALILEALALRHQIAVLKRSRTRRPCFRRWDRLFWIWLSWWWPSWRESLLIVQPQTSCAGAVTVGLHSGVSFTPPLDRWTAQDFR